MYGISTLMLIRYLLKVVDIGILKKYTIHRNS
nr:hypothetical protein [Providencia rettgeri]